MTPSHAYYHYTTARSLYLFRLMERLDAVGADLNALAVHPCPLEIGMLPILRCRIVLAAKFDSSLGHRRFFTALRTSCCHSV